MKSELLLILGILTVCPLDGATLVIEGKYQNRNIYVRNSYLQGGVGFCAREIKVNGKITTDETNSSAFEIDLRSMQLAYGQDVRIEIAHSEECTPKILNIEDLKPKPSFEVLVMHLSPAGLFKWSTKNEGGSLPYVIEQFKWNKWVAVGELAGAGTPGIHNYSFQLSLHSGENKFRLRQRGFNGITRISQEIRVNSNVNKPSYAIPKNRSSIDFSSDTEYEIYDAYGQVVMKGFGKQIKISNLARGQYYLCYDNCFAEFSRR